MFATSCVLFLAATSASAGPSALVVPGDQAAAATALVGRIMGSALGSQFAVKVSGASSSPGTNSYSTDAAADKIVLTGSTGVEVANALNQYLNQYLNVTVDWNTYGMNQLPPDTAKLPRPTKTVTKTRKVPWSYYMNVCTYGYSLDFIPWETDPTDTKVQSWVKHIDWMALQGINLPLAFVGQEYIWTKVFASYNLTFEEQASFYSGPAFLPWFRMGNMRGWGGPITMEWLESRRDLQVKMLQRMRSLGMTPVLPAFAGHIPHAFQAKYPATKTSRSPDWANFNKGDPHTAPYADVYLVEPVDPMFVELGNKFIELQTLEYGTDHIYNCDTYNEMQPPTSDPAYLKAAANAVYQGMAKADPDATWLMQGWLFLNTKFWTQEAIEAYLGGVEKGKMWLLDLFGDSTPLWSRTASYYGHPFIWCTLLNFGGQQGIFGNAKTTLANLEAAYNSNSSINGVGITMEGIWTNYPIFEMTLQAGYEPLPEQPSPTEATLPAWFENYGVRRYGKEVQAAVDVWTLLGSTVHAGNGGGGFGSEISTYPTMPTPPPPPPPAVAGFKVYPQHGYFGVVGNDTYAAPSARASIADCGQLCLKTDNCKGFEVYVDTPPAFGNCYFFKDTTTPFTVLTPCATYVRSSESDSKGVQSAEAIKLQAASSSSSSSSSIHPFSHVPASVVAHKGPDMTAAGTDAYITAFQKLVAASSELGSVPSYRFDLVDVAREVISKAFSVEVGVFFAAFFRGSKADTAASGAKLLSIIDDYDLILSSDTNFQLGRWLEWAKLWSKDPASIANLEMQARNILTLWGPTGQINDYAKKEWGGLVRDYYKERWSLFIAEANGSLAKGVPFSQSDVDAKIFSQVELPFQNATKVYPTTPETDAVTTATALLAKYAPPSEVVV